MYQKLAGRKIHFRDVWCLSGSILNSVCSQINKARAQGRSMLLLPVFTSGACPHELRRSNPFIYASRQTVHTWLLVICLNVSFFLAFRDGANEAEGGDVCRGVQRKIQAGIVKAVYENSSRVLCGGSSQEVIAHSRVFTPNQAQQQAAPPRAIDWRRQARQGRNERGNERSFLAVIRRYLAVTALVSLNS